VFLPNRSGFEVCRYIKSHPRHRHARVILTAGLLEPFDEEEAKRAGCDGILKKPFEASLVMSTIQPLLVEARLARSLLEEQMNTAPHASFAVETPPEVPKTASETPDPERVRAAITIALDAALPALIQEITDRVLVALGH
jgi:CheY-like chemotaxis protein